MFDPRSIYKVLDIARLGLHSLAVHKVRSTLTALGIIVGVMGVIATIAISEGGSYEAQMTLRELGSDNIIIDSQKPLNDQPAAGRSHTQTYGLTRQDIKRLETVPRIKKMAIVHRQRKTARVGVKMVNTSILSTEPSYDEIARIRMAVGRFFTVDDMNTSSPYCVLTQALARNLFQYKDPMNQIVVLGGQPFRVIGLIEKIPRALVDQAGDSDNCAMIPLSTDRSRFGLNSVEITPGTFSSESVFASQVVLQMEDEQALVDGAGIARNLLARGHPGGHDYKVTIPQELLDQQKKQRRLWNVVFLAVSLIALVVGGIGIMNIMLATVTERTREIGIRRALGATRRDITIQFVIESVTLAAVGGLLGIALGVAMHYVIGILDHFIPDFHPLPMILSAWTLLLPFVVAVLVGLLSGLYPAMRAARLDPIVALRHE